MFAATLIVWSEIGHTPVTGRAGSYCDELLNQQIEVRDHQHAREILLAAIDNVRHAATGSVSIPSYPNQNYRSIWN